MVWQPWSRRRGTPIRPGGHNTLRMNGNIMLNFPAWAREGGSIIKKMSFLYGSPYQGINLGVCPHNSLDNPFHPAPVFVVGATQVSQAVDRRETKGKRQ